MNQRRSPLGLRSKLVLLFVVFAIIPLLAFGIYAYKTATNMVTQQVSQVVSENLSQVNHSLDYLLRDIEQLTTYIYSNQTIREVLAQPPGRDLVSHYADRQTINALLDSFIGTKSWDIEIYILGQSGDTFFTSELLPEGYRSYDVNWGLFRKAVAADGGIVWDTHYATTKIHDYGVVLSGARMLKHQETNEPLGFVVVDVKERTLADVYDKTKLFEGGETILLDSGGYVVSSTPSKLRVGTLLNAVYLPRVLGSPRGSFHVFDDPNGSPTSTVVFESSSVTGMVLVNVVPMQAFASASAPIRTAMVAIIIGFTVFSFWLAIFLSTNLTRPIQRLQNMMSKAEQGYLDVSVPVKAHDEIGMLSGSFNHMLARLRNLLDDAHEKHKQLREAELKVIQAQFNPHFLYNALDSINWMARIHGVDEVSDAAVALGGLLRYSIQTDREFIPVHEEIQQVRNYLTVQQMRYRDKFRTTIEVEPEVLDCFTLKLLLQPLVENAILHGLEPKTTAGHLRLSATKDKEQIRFTIEDDGVGFQPSKNRPPQSHTGIGLENVKRRLELHFGGNHTFDVHTQAGKGTRVVIAYPIVDEAGMNHVLNHHR